MVNLKLFSQLQKAERDQCQLLLLCLNPAVENSRAQPLVVACSTPVDDIGQPSRRTSCPVWSRSTAEKVTFPDPDAAN